jgi:hypothetical protein
MKIRDICLAESTTAEHQWTAMTMRKMLKYHKGRIVISQSHQTLKICMHDVFRVSVVDIRSHR